MQKTTVLAALASVGLLAGALASEVNVAPSDERELVSSERGPKWCGGEVRVEKSVGLQAHTPA
jgi:hypothetical protein